jgi:hypothetical protein
MTTPVDLQSSVRDGALKDVRGAAAATAICGGRTRSESPLELDLPLNAMDLIIQTLHFAGELVDGLDEILNDIEVGALLLRFAKEDLCFGGCLPHGDPNRVKLAGIREASSNSCCKILTTGRLSWQSGATRTPKMRDHLRQARNI